ncbi:glycosyl hydrolase [Emericellopsis atlantica]|uniref:Glycosyl hydrolase n=1 Tax=Emericellopsis atlantica TaxID=2614577 RepID=A0A9P8CNH4_9HYPO|nr:glycosyl hydrolase [Emericellopsis atlantica]KAG9253137.1 glycosyl hydrolase [Emericellopsis atlantica]
MRLLNCLVGTAVLASSAVAAPPGKVKTPQFFNAARHPGADPHVIWDAASHQYYVYSTEGADPGYNFAIYSSPDLATWHRHEGGVLRACYDDDMNRLPGGQACWARDWYWAPETYHNEETGWYFFFFAGRMTEDLTADNFRYSEFEEPSKIGVAVSKSPTGPFEEIEDKPIDYWPFDPNYHDVNLIMDKDQMLPPQSREEGQTAPMGTFIPTIDVNIFFDEDERVYLYASRNAYRNWNWDDELGKYIEESNIIVVEMDRAWWDDPTASTMPEIIASQKDIHAHDAPSLPCNITSYNGTGELGAPPRKDGWQTVISYGADPQAWENYHVNDYEVFNGTKKDRRWSEGSTLLKRPGQHGQSTYIILYSANNYEASNYSVGYATAESPLGPFVKSTSNPILSQDPDAAIPIYSTGHGSVVASPPKGKGVHVGAQDVTRQTPKGAELFYVHHGRNDTTVARSLYTTRMTLDEENVRFGSNDLITTHLTSQDQDLPKGTYPLHMEASCSQKGQVTVQVESKPGAAFDLTEGSNRVVGLPGDVEATTVTGESGSFELDFGQAGVKDVAYQRLSVDGSWNTVITRKTGCKK